MYLSCFYQLDNEDICSIIALATNSQIHQSVMITDRSFEVLMTRPRSGAPNENIVQNH